MSQRIIIIGAGPGGLAASLLLANAGFEVCVLEKGSRIGGRTGRIERDGFRWDVGPTFFLYPQILREIFESVGADLDAEAPTVRLDPQYSLFFGAGGRIDATPDVVRMQEQIEDMAPGNGAGFERFLADNRAKFSAFRSVLERPFNHLGDYLRWDMIKALPHLRPHKSLDQDLHRFFDDERIRLAFSFQSKYLGMSPFRCPSLFSILSYLEYEHGVHHPVGGCHSLMEAMARVARQKGVEIRLEAEVDKLLFRGHRVVGARVGGEEIAADAVVMNGDFAAVLPRLVPDDLRRRWSNARIERSRYSCSTFMMYLGVDGVLSDIPHHGIHVSSDYAHNLRQIEVTREVPESPSFYVHNPCVTDPSMAPEGKSALYVLVPVPHRGGSVDWAREAEPFREKIYDRLEAAGMPDLRSRVEHEIIKTPADWEGADGIHLGATFNLSHDLGQMLHRRPKNRFDDVKGLYLVGGGTHPGSGLPVIFESAKISSRLIEKDLRKLSGQDAISRGLRRIGRFARVGR